MNFTTNRRFLEKITIFLFASICISTSSNNYINYLLALLYNILVLLGIVNLTLCVFTMPSLNYIVSGIIITEVLNIFQWWSLFLNRKKIQRLSILLSNESIRKQHFYSKVCVVLTICTTLIFPFVFYIAYSVSLMLSEVTQTRCSFGIILSYDFKSITLFVLHMFKYYNRTAIPQVVAFLYFHFCYLILRSQSQLTNKIDKKNPLFSLQAWKRCQNLVCIIEKLENAMSFMAFITIVNIGIVIFIFIEVMFEDKLEGITYTAFCFQTFNFIVWFLAISFTADGLQQRIHKSLSLVFKHRYALRINGVKLDYFTYTEMIRKCSLTGWKIFIINRNLLLTFFASLVTYGVIIHQSK